MKTDRAGGLRLITGGAFQGKREYVRRELGIRDEEIFLCHEDRGIDQDALCLDHFERYLRGCIKRGEKPAGAESFHEGTVIICEDITCGIVPMDPLDRKWREVTGRFLQEAAGSGASVTRIFCGIPQALADPRKGLPPLEKEILLLRHGMTEANEKHLYCGSLDLPLSREGRKALSDDALKDSPGCWDAFYFSGMKRTLETLQILFGQEAAANAAECGDLREMDFGIFEGRSYEELKDRPDYQAWLSGCNEKNVCPGGESGSLMEDRVLSAFEKILGREPEKRIVIVTHGGPIAAIMQKLFPGEGKNRYEWQSGFGKGYLLHISAGERSRDGKIRLGEAKASYIPFPVREKTERNGN